MEHSYFWPDLDGDREYDDDDLAEYSGGFVTHGVFGGDLAVAPGSGMTVTLPAGRAYVGPAWKVRKYYNDSPLTLPIANADGVLNRRDIIVLRSDVNDRSVTAKVIQGEFASNPVAPAIVRDAEQYDIELCEVSIPAGTTEITGALITDKRLDSSVCGIVTGVMQQVDTTTFYNQVKDDLAQFKSGSEADFTAWDEAQRASFVAWLSSIQDVLDADTAGHLLNLINAITDSKGQPNGIAELDDTGKVPKERLPTTGGYVRQDSAPTDTSLLWMDSANGDIVKYYNGTAWAPVPATWG
mgnify:FL=1